MAFQRGQWEPRYGGVIVRTARAHHTERVRIRWTMPDGSTFYEDRTAPPLEHVTAVRARAIQTRRALGVE